MMMVFVSCLPLPLCLERKIWLSDVFRRRENLCWAANEKETENISHSLPSPGPGLIGTRTLPINLHCSLLNLHCLP